MSIGKRFAGKDTVGRVVAQTLSELSYDYEFNNFADEFKKLFCQHAGLDFSRLMSDREYKVQFFEITCCFFSNNSTQTALFYSLSFYVLTFYLLFKEQHRTQMVDYYNEIKDTVNFADHLFSRIKEQCISGLPRKKVFFICDVRELTDITCFKNRFSFISLSIAYFFHFLLSP